MTAELRRQGLWAAFNPGIASHWHNLKFFVLTGCIQNSGFLLRTPGVHFYRLLAHEISLKGREDGLVDNTLAVDVWGPEFRSQTHAKWDRVVHSCHSFSHLSYSKMRSRDREPPRNSQGQPAWCLHPVYKRSSFNSGPKAVFCPPHVWHPHAHPAQELTAAGFHSDTVALSEGADNYSRDFSTLL